MAAGANRSQMTEDYLKAVYAAEERGADGMSVSELADRVGVVASTASENVRRLTELGLVEHQPYQTVRLTSAGRSQAVAMVRRHRLLETYLHEQLDFDWDEVHSEAEILEHAVSDRLLEHLDRALGYPTRDPHGDPIPAADGSWVAPPMKAVAELPVGQGGMVARISDASSLMLRELESAGVVLDCHVVVTERLEGLELTRIRVTAAGTAGVGSNGADASFTMDLPPVAAGSIFVATGEDAVSEPR